MLVFTPSLIQIGVTSEHICTVSAHSIARASGQESLMCSGIGQKILTPVHQDHANVELQELVKNFLGNGLHLLKLKKISLDQNKS